MKNCLKTGNLKEIESRFDTEQSKAPTVEQLTMNVIQVFKMFEILE